jgi:hypothetical protein
VLTLSAKRARRRRIHGDQGKCHGVRRRFTTVSILLNAAEMVLALKIAQCCGFFLGGDAIPIAADATVSGQ